MKYPILTIAALAMLSGCEVKRGTETEEPSPAPMPAASESVSLTAQAEEPASIIRPDVSPSPLLDLPPDPLAATIGFPDGGYELDPQARKLLHTIISSDQAKRGWPIVLRGHTDSEGNDQGNLFASRKRAEAVAGWLADNGIDEDRIEIIALGEGRPVAPNVRLDGTPDERGRRQNRRVDVWIAPPGIEPADEADGAQTTLPDDA
jgi:OOP family OmpA-OmpF porin